MTNRITFIATSLLATIFLTLHLADDFTHHGGTSLVGFFTAAAIVVVWLYAVLVIGASRWGYIIATVWSLLGLFVVAFHIVQHGGVDSAMAGSSDPYFFVSTLFALCITSLFSLVLAIRGALGKL